MSYVFQNDPEAWVMTGGGNNSNDAILTENFVEAFS